MSYKRVKEDVFSKSSCFEQNQINKSEISHQLQPEDFE
jgi:hypothetical protein